MMQTLALGNFSKYFKSSLKNVVYKPVILASFVLNSLVFLIW